MNDNRFYDSNGKALSLDEVLFMLPQVCPLNLVTRVEVIDNNGRAYINRNKDNKVEISLQDCGKTLKVFIYSE